jgi:signal transduction histidine kinase
LKQLAQGAISEMQVLISELRPAKFVEGGLAAALRQHIAERQLPDTLAITLEVDGEQNLTNIEEQNLFRIAQEAVNNIVKHSCAYQACIRLHLAEPFWMEITDQGLGFDLQHTHSAGHVGLKSMEERAVEIGWNFQIQTSPTAGTCIRVYKS